MYPELLKFSEILLTGKRAYRCLGQTLCELALPQIYPRKQRKERCTHNLHSKWRYCQLRNGIIQTSATRKAVCFPLAMWLVWDRLNSVVYHKLIQSWWMSLKHYTSISCCKMWPGRFSSPSSPCKLEVFQGQTCIFQQVPITTQF